MKLSKQFENTGNWLFRWRSYLPLLMLGLLILAMKDIRYPDHTLDQLWEMFCLAVAFFGLGIRALTVGYVPKGTSGRNTTGQKATVLNTTGMYSVVRHPLYLANFFMWLGVSMLARLWWFSLIIVLIFWLYYERIMFAEEKFLENKFGDAFSKWAETTPAFFPNLKKWTSPDLPFSLKTVFKREYSTLFAIISTFTALEILGDLLTKNKFVFDPLWGILFTTGLVVYLTLMILKKKTKVLDAKGR